MSVVFDCLVGPGFCSRTVTVPLFVVLKLLVHHSISELQLGLFGERNLGRG